MEAIVSHSGDSFLAKAGGRLRVDLGEFAYSTAILRSARALA